MAQFNLELPLELMEDMRRLYTDAPKIFEAMTTAGAEVVYNNVIANMKRSFQDSSKLEPYLKVTKAYRTYDGKFVNTKVAFYGYYKEGERTHTVKRGETAPKTYKSGKGYRMTKTSTGQKSAEYKYDGVPVALIAIAREYGTSMGEQKKPFFRKAFKQKEIEEAMWKAQREASGGLLDNE